MFNRKSSYALNKKDPNAIVYMDANEAIIRLTIMLPRKRIMSTLIIPLHWTSFPRKQHLFPLRISAWSRRMTGWRKSAVAPKRLRTSGST